MAAFSSLLARRRKALFLAIAPREPLIIANCLGNTSFSPSVFIHLFSLGRVKIAATWIHCPLAAWPAGHSTRDPSLAAASRCTADRSKNGGNGVTAPIHRVRDAARCCANSVMPRAVGAWQLFRATVPPAPPGHPCRHRALAGILAGKARTSAGQRKLRRSTLGEMGMTLRGAVVVFSDHERDAGLQCRLYTYYTKTSSARSRRTRPRPSRRQTWTCDPLRPLSRTPPRCSLCCIIISRRC